MADAANDNVEPDELLELPYAYSGLHERVEIGPGAGPR